MNEKINAVEIVRRIRDDQQKVLKGKSVDEVKAFYHERASKLNSKLKKILDGSERGTSV